MWNVSCEAAKNLIFKFFNLKIVKIKELTGYDDKNFHVVTETREEFVFKVTNAEDTLKNGDVMKNILDLLGFLKEEAGFPVPECVKNRDSDFIKVIEIDGKNHAIRLFKFIKGDVLDEAHGSEQLYREVGKFCGSFCVEMQRFPDGKKIFKNYSSEWHLEKTWQHCKPKLGHIPESRREMVAAIFENFEKTVISQFNLLEIGLIHTDLNGRNILVEGLKITGVIDFNEVTVSALIFELAVLVTHCMLHAGSLEVERFVVDAFLEKKSLPKRDLDCLELCIKARLCQCLVLCAASAALDPHNLYLTENSEKFWVLLDEFERK